MPGKLKPLDVHREQKPGKRADGDGLYLIVAGATSKNWSYRYWFKGKERWHGLGSFKDVSLKDARLARDAARLQVRAGVDLVQEKRAAREEKKAVEAMGKAKNARKPISMSIGTVGVRSIAGNGPPRSSATSSRRLCGNASGK